jgi:adenosylcobinamide-GDP ribazoletransferase
MKPFLNALKFLTLFPVGSKDLLEKRDFAKMMALFPVAGLAIGLLLAVSGEAMRHFFPDMLTAAILVVMLIGLTGGLHMDGLADTFDGMAGGRDAAGKLAIMKDSRIGTMGVLAIVSIFILKLQLIALIPGDLRFVALLTMPAFSRWSMLIPVKFFTYARREGTGKIFFESITSSAFAIATLLMLVIAAACLKLPGFCILVTVGGFTFLWSLLVSRQIGGITGDVVGATNELIEVFFLFTFYLCRGVL